MAPWNRMPSKLLKPSVLTVNTDNFNSQAINMSKQNEVWFICSFPKKWDPYWRSSFLAMQFFPRIFFTSTNGHSQSYHSAQKLNRHDTPLVCANQLVMPSSMPSTSKALLLFPTWEIPLPSTHVLNCLKMGTRRWTYTIKNIIDVLGSHTDLWCASKGTRPRIAG